MRLEGWHIVIIIVIAILLFGAPKLPGLARSLGQSLRIFKSEVKQMKDDDKPRASAEEPVEGRIVPNDAGTPGTAGQPPRPGTPGTPGSTGGTNSPSSGA
ncbi:Sec-independent protein translocase protein TatA [Arthrobacter saudimassiliensis]|uniref:Sec-independent protein translocase protein TatA n=1 Tax=Arthrobacter saudimassiliensis TaxID=1461584 RepID=A0A078MTL5_9MICC|nr:Sec-independent protein translocase protein TatA [Arthrobacter saudimassiliensis]